MLMQLAVLIGLPTMAAILGGFVFLKAYEDFKKGVERKSKLRIWSVFFVATFFLTSLVFSLVRVALVLR